MVSVKVVVVRLTWIVATKTRFGEMRQLSKMERATDSNSGAKNPSMITSGEKLTSTVIS